MKIYIFLSDYHQKKLAIDCKKIREILHCVAMGTDTSDLVVSLYFNAKNLRNGGTAMTRHWVLPGNFHPKRGPWRQFHSFPIPPDLPPQFKLIRLVMMTDHSLYPLIQKDIYRWIHHYPSFEDHLAHLFAHEIHHYRRFHLGFHQNEGEHSANLWALNHVVKLGFPVASQKMDPVRPKKTRKQKIDLSLLIKPAEFPKILTSNAWHNAFLTIYHKYLHPSHRYFKAKYKHFEQLRSLKPGARLLIHFDPHHKYSGEIVTVERILRKSSLRMVIRTRDGKLWRWPMAWLKEVPED